MYQRFNDRQATGIGRGIRDSFVRGSVLTRLIYINCGLFLILKLAHVLFLLGGNGQDFYPRVMEWLGVPAGLENLATHPWSPLTYMFTHFEFLHLLFNMLWLYWFGTLFMEHFTQRQLGGLYVLGGLAGALGYVAAYNIFPYFEGMQPFSWAIGASASVMAVVFALCSYQPGYRVYIFLIGPVKLAYLALFTVLIDILGIPAGNAGGHIAHLGGALCGWLFAAAIRRNVDISAGPARLGTSVRKLFTPRKRRMRVKYRRKDPGSMNSREYQSYRKERDEALNAILDKISRSGYESLTPEEKALLFNSRND